MKIGDALRHIEDEHIPNFSEQFEDEEERIAMHDNIDRETEKGKMAIYTFWMFLILWCAALHYFAWIGLMASIERT